MCIRPLVGKDHMACYMAGVLGQSLESQVWLMMERLHLQLECQIMACILKGGLSLFLD